MADWTSIPDVTFDPDRPVLGSTHLAIVKNFEALAEGAASAPRISASALQTGDPERDWVLARTAGASARVLGTYTTAYYVNNGTMNNNTASFLAVNSTVAGSTLRVSSRGTEFNISVSNRYFAFNSFFSGTSASFLTTDTTTLAGTWRLMSSGAYKTSAQDGDDNIIYTWYPHLWLRIA